MMGMYRGIYTNKSNAVYLYGYAQTYFLEGYNLSVYSLTHIYTDFIYTFIFFYVHLSISIKRLSPCVYM